MARKNLSNRRNWLLIISLTLIACGCQPTPTQPAAQPIRTLKNTGKPYQVVCTTGMVADLVQQIAGERAQVSTLMGEGVDPHLYKASPGDLSLLNRADVVIYSGLHLEGKLAQVLEHLGQSKPVLAAAESIPPDKILTVGGSAHDPHVWMDVSLWSATATGIIKFLSEVDPAHAPEYAARGATLTQSLTKLDQDIRQTLAEIPAEHRVLVTAHDAFRYFGRAYDVEVRGIQGISTDSEAGVKQVNELVSFLVERKIKAVFVESSVSEQNVRSLLEGCQSRGHTVIIGGELFSDAMGKAGTAEGTYDGMIRHNAQTMAHALK